MLMAGENGNLAQVRAALGRDLEIGDIVDYSPFNPLLAQIAPNVTPRWHVIDTHPHRERTAAGHLIGRMFGVFIPEIEETIIHRGRKADRTRLMFTGYIFVFVWDILEHQHRIKSVPGVSRILFVDGSPAILSDQMIDQIRAVENAERPLPALMMPPEFGRSKKKKRWRKSIKEQSEIEWEKGNEVVACRPWSPFQDSLKTLDVQGRNQTLLKALSLS